MRALAAMMTVLFALDAAAQQPPAPPPSPSPPPAPSSPSTPPAPSAPSTIHFGSQADSPPASSPSASPPSSSSSTPPTVTFHSEGMAPPPPPSTQLPATLHAAPSPDTVTAWHTARFLSVFGSVLSIAGTGLSLASIIYIGATNYPPSANSLLTPQAKPSDPGPVLAYVGSSASAVGFVFTATGLGLEHNILDKMGADPGRGIFGVGTTFGIVGFSGVALSYFFGLTNYLNPHDQSIAILTTTIGGAALCGIASILYSIDSSHVKKAWSDLTTF